VRESDVQLHACHVADSSISRQDQGDLLATDGVVVGYRQEPDISQFGFLDDLFNSEGTVGAFRVNVQVYFHCRIA
jgi:hypothetical protein